MRVKEIIKILYTMPMDAEVFHLWDGEPRTKIEHIWLAKNGKVITADNGEICYSNKNEPITIKKEKKQKFWHTPEKKNNKG